MTDAEEYMGSGVVVELRCRVVSDSRRSRALRPLVTRDSIRVTRFELVPDDVDPIDGELRSDCSSTTARPVGVELRPASRYASLSAADDMSGVPNELIDWFGGVKGGLASMSVSVNGVTSSPLRWGS